MLTSGVRTAASRPGVLSLGAVTIMIAPPDAPAPEAARRRVRRYAPLAAGILLVAVTAVVGHVLRERGALPIDAQPPFHTVPRLPGGDPRLLTWSMWPAVGYAALMVAALPRLARARWPYALAGSWLAAVGWALTLAATDGVSRIWTTLTTQYDYLRGLPAMGDHPLAWLRGFTRALPAYPEHVKGHPPLPMLILWALDHLGLHGPVPAALLLVGAGCAAVPAIATTLSVVAGTAFARRALPFLVLSPTAMFVATSMDALFLGVCATGIALLALATAARPRIGPAGARRTGHPGVAITAGRAGFRGAASAEGSRTDRSATAALEPGRSAHARPPVLAFAGGVLLGCAPYLSYALLTIGALVLAVLIARRPPLRVVLALVAGALVMPAAMTAAGFWWPDGVAATSSAWAASAGGNRPYLYFLFGDLAVLTACLGPAVLAGLGAGRGIRTEWRRWILPVGALVAVLALDLSGVTRGEVERIWLPYAAWMGTVTGFLRPPARGWLAAQAVVALVMQATMGSPW